MGESARGLGIKLPEELDRDPIEAAWSVASKGVNMGRIIIPGLLPMFNKVAASASAMNALFAVGTANILLLYVNIWLALGGAYAAVRENAKAKGTIMGFCTGFGYRLADDYDYGELSWHYISTKPTKFQREVHEVLKNAFNSGLIRGASAAAYLKPAHRNAIVKELDKAVKGRYPASFDRGQRYASFMNYHFRKYFDV